MLFAPLAPDEQMPDYPDTVTLGLIPIPPIVLPMEVCTRTSVSTRGCPNPQLYRLDSDGSDPGSMRYVRVDHFDHSPVFGIRRYFGHHGRGSAGVAISVDGIKVHHPAGDRRMVVLNSGPRTFIGSSVPLASKIRRIRRRSTAY
jgi:hypothetical protein